MKMLFNSIAFVILMLKHNRISCATIANDNYSGESKQVLNILNDMQTDASFHNPYHHSYGHHLDLAPVTHEGHNSDHKDWDDIDKGWETGSGAHHSVFDKHGNQGYDRHFLDVGEGYHDKHNDGFNAGNFEGYDDRSLWSRDRGQDHERNTKWDRELQIKKANSDKAGHISKFHNIDNGFNLGLKRIDDNAFNIFSGRGRHSGQGWHELDRYRANKGQYGHDSGYRDTHSPIAHTFH